MIRIINKTALWWTGHLIIYYEVFDLMVGWEAYWVRDKMMILHHLVTACGGWILLDCLGSEDKEVVNIVRSVMCWAMLSEVTTVFNALRIVTGAWGSYVKFVTETLFAGVFCSLRTIQTVGMAWSLVTYWSNPFFMTCVYFWTFYTVLNVIWVRAIIRKFIGSVNGLVKVKDE